MKRKIMMSELKKLNTFTKKLKKGDLSTYKEKMEVEEIADSINNLNETTQMINSYINDISEIVSRISIGDLSGNIDKEKAYKGDFLPIKNAINKTVNSLNGVFCNINLLMNSINKTCTNTNELTSVVAKNAKEQTLSIDLLSSSIENIYELAQSSSEKIEEINIQIVNTKNETKQGVECINEMMQSMSEVSRAAENINEIVKLIKEISNQTELLSLNASIEAAKAKEAGKGFGVVAIEIKKLADQTAESVHSTSDLVNTSIAKVNETNEIVKKTISNFENIKKSITQVEIKNDEIVMDSKKQKVALENMIDIINNIYNKVQENSKIANDTSDNNEYLKNEVEKLKTELSYFILKGENKNKINDKTIIRKKAEDFILKLINEINSKKTFLNLGNLIFKDEMMVECVYIIDEKGEQVTDTIMNKYIIEEDLEFEPALKGANHSEKKYFMEGINNKLSIYETFQYISSATGNLCQTFVKTFKLNEKCYLLCVDLSCMI